MRPFFLNVESNRLFCVYHEPKHSETAPVGVLLLPPFAEEMNQSRSFHASLARMLSGSGISSLMFDLSGTGDSSGEFRDADWTRWQRETLAAYQWLSQVTSTVYLFALRSAGLLLSSFESKLSGRFGGVYVVEPMLTGERLFADFLRIKVARSMFEGRRDTVDSLRRQLNTGATLEVGGYELSSKLYRELNAASLGIASTAQGRTVRWLGSSSYLEGLRNGSDGAFVKGEECGHRLVKLDFELSWSNDGLMYPEQLAECVAECLCEP